MINLDKYSNKKILLSIIVILILVAVVLYISTSFLGKDHLTDEYDVNKSIGQVTEENSTITVEDENEELDSIYILTNRSSEEQKISNDGRVRINPIKKTIVTVIGKSNSGEKYILDTFELNQSRNITGT